MSVQARFIPPTAVGSQTFSTAVATQSFGPAFGHASSWHATASRVVPARPARVMPAGGRPSIAGNDPGAPLGVRRTSAVGASPAPAYQSAAPALSPVPAAALSAVPATPSLPISPVDTSLDAGAAISPTLRRQRSNSKDDTNDEDTAAVRKICSEIDADHNGHVSKLEFIRAVAQDVSIAKFVLPHLHSIRHVPVDLEGLKMDEVSFDAIDSRFDELAHGRHVIPLETLVRELRQCMHDDASNSIELRNIFNAIDEDGDGTVSKLEFIAALQKEQQIGRYMLPGIDCTRVLQDEAAFDAVECLFTELSSGKRRFDFSDFEAHYKEYYSASSIRPEIQTCDHSQIRVMVIGPGFGTQINPGQINMLVAAGFQLDVIHDLPNPETPHFPVHTQLPKLKQQIDTFDPDVIVAASKGGVYVIRLWQTGLWLGPTVLINMHPTCSNIPHHVPVVVAHGECDETYPADRTRFEQIMATGGKNMTYFHFVGSSGYLQGRSRTRNGDTHNMASLQKHDCLPRMIDAVLSPMGPETFMFYSARFRLSEERRIAEEFLGYTPEKLRKKWISRNQRGMDDEKLFAVAPNSEEYQAVSTVFKAAPVEPPYYGKPNTQAGWEAKRIKSIQRIENGLQVDGCTFPYYTSMRRSLEAQGVTFEPGTHTLWSFHGADAAALDSIITDPMAGVRPIVAGARANNLWGKGTYLARDAKYVAESGFAGQPAADGTLMMLMCLTMTGTYCQGSESQNGLLPFRQPGYRYLCSVDYLSAPEIYIVQQSGAVLPAYLITFYV